MPYTLNRALCSPLLLSLVASASGLSLVASRPALFARPATQPLVGSPHALPLRSRQGAIPSEGGDDAAVNEPAGARDEGAAPSTRLPTLQRLRPHQQRALNNTFAHWDSGGTRATVVMPGGSGKTLVGLGAAEEVVRRAAPSGAVIVVALPSRALVTQASVRVVGAAAATAAEMVAWR